MPVYVQHQVLGSFDDVFDAGAIWQAPGLSLFHRRPLLRDLLERSPREHRGRAPTRCFTHVALTLPQEELDDDRHLTRGARARELADALAALHRQDFGDLLGDDEVRYDVRGAATVPAGQIAVRFGHAVYVPAPGESVLYTVTASNDGHSWLPVCSVHAQQRLVVLGGAGGMVSHAIPDWPFASEAALVLLNDGPDQPPELQVRPRPLLDCSFDALGACYTVRATGGEARLYLRIHRCAGAAPVTHPVWKRRSAEATVAASAVPAAAAADATYAPAAPRQASLVALALPRLSRFRDTGAARLELGFDALLQPDSGPAAVLRLCAGADDTLSAVTRAGTETLTLPAQLSPGPGKSLSLRPAPPALADRYSALVLLPGTRSVPVGTDGALHFGRAAEGLAQLRVLPQVAVLRQQDGSVTQAERLGLSRQACALRPQAGGWEVVRLSASQALAHLDPQLRFVAPIEATPEHPYLLPAGHHLVAGAYVLRLDA